MKPMVGALLGLALASSAAAQPDGLHFVLGLSKPTFLPGEQVFATATLKNDSSVPLTCVYSMSPGGHVTLALQDVTRGLDLRPNWIACGIAVFEGCVLEPGGEHLEVINLTEIQGKPDSVKLGIPEPLIGHTLLPGLYTVFARYYVSAVRGRKDYSLHSNLVTFEVRPPAQEAASQIWRQLSHFDGNTPEYRDTLSAFVEGNSYDPFVASLYLDSSLFHQSVTRRDSVVRMVSRHPNSDLAGYLMGFLVLWESRGWIQWPDGFLDDLRDRYPESLATRVAESGIKYWECYNAGPERNWRDR